MMEFDWLVACFGYATFLKVYVAEKKHQIFHEEALYVHVCIEAWRVH